MAKNPIKTPPKWTEVDYGFQKSANPGREIKGTLEGKEFYRYPVRTHLVQIGESYLELVKKYIMPSLQKGDIIVCSEKVIGICQNQLVHESKIKVGRLAKLIAQYVDKFPDDIGWENPKKIQVAIDLVGYPRTVLAVVVGGIMKFLFRQPGWYYRIMGRDVVAIDGFNPIAIPPFNEYASLAPAHPHKTAQKIADVAGANTIIVDASNIATHILGRSIGIPYTDEELSQILKDNPMGQSREQTPFLIIRPV